jgi:hypothetical protein
MSRLTATAVPILFAVWLSISTANAGYLFLNNMVLDGNTTLCSAYPSGGSNTDTFAGPISGTASCGSGGYSGNAYSAVVPGSIGGLGQPAMAQLTATNVLAGQPRFLVQMGGQWQDQWNNLISSLVIETATYTLTSSVLTTGVDPGSGYAIDAIAELNDEKGDDYRCHVGDGSSTLNGTCTVTATFGPNGSILQVGSVLSDVWIQAVRGSDSFSITLDPANLFTLTALSFTDINGNPLPFSDIQSSTGIALTATGYASASVPEPSSLLLALTAITFLLMSRTTGALWKCALEKVQKVRAISS